VLAEALTAHHLRIAALTTHEVARFTALCDDMFSTFTSRHKRGRGTDAVDWFAAGGNLDTGDSSFLPPDRAVDALTNRALLLDEITRYIGPETEKSLEDAFWHFLETRGFDMVAHRSQLGTVVGVGTVNLYAAACRDVLTQSRDVVLVPDVGYGFFLAQPYRCGGAVRPITSTREGKVHADLLRCNTRAVNAELYGSWWVQRQHEVAAALSQSRSSISLEERDAVGLVVGQIPPTPNDGLARLSDGLGSLGLHHLLDIVRPPRVRASPTVTGALYDRAEIQGIGDALDELDVAAIEDFAYHSIRVDGPDLPSLLGRTRTCYTLFGLSKPFGLANVRIGMMVTAASDVPRLRRIVENHVGFVPLATQRCAAAVLGTPSGEMAALLSHHNLDREEGYETRMRLLLGLLEGSWSSDDSELRDRARVVALNFLQAKREDGVECCPVTQYEAVVESFLRLGLTRWFEVRHRPDAGFFVILDCARLLDSRLLDRAGLPASGSFDVFAFLAYGLGVRTIPEEAMGPSGSECRHLRVACSPTVRVLVETVFTTYLALMYLESVTSGECR
jgi:aspartate/methionine/tyrosine aminotransferase